MRMTLLSVAWRWVPGVVLLCLIGSGRGLAGDQHLVVPGHQRFAGNTLSADDAGRVLVSELNCQSCHGEFAGLPLPARKAPVLTHVGQRVNPEFIHRLLEDPQKAKPGTAMPLIPGATSKEAREALVAFLTDGANWRPGAVGADAVRRGEALFHRVGCASCHGDQRDPETIRQLRLGLNPVNPDDEEDEEKKDVPAEDWKAPDFVMPLGKLDDKYTLSSLIDFLRNPHAVRPSGRMPSLNLSPEEARDIASWLLRDVKVEPNIRFEYYEGDWSELPDFATLKTSFAGRTTDFSAGVTDRKDSFALRFSGFIHLPSDAEYRFHLSSDDGARLKIDGDVVVDNDGVHPAGFREGKAVLTAGAHELVLEYFEAHGEEAIALEIEGGGLSRQPASGLVTLTNEPPKKEETENKPADGSLVEQGRKLFASLGCAACHQHGDGDRQIKWTGTAPAMAGLQSEKGCLAETVATTVPAFAFSPEQRTHLRAALAAQKQTRSEDRKAELRLGMVTMNCFACHARDGLAPDASLNHVFTGSIPEMGDEGRVPPALDGAGDKLNDAWLRTLLNEGAKDRPYMATRMPKFGSDQGNPIVDRLIALDRQPDEAAFAQAEAEHRVKADARMLVGDKGLSCIKCHIFDRHAATGIQSLDMTKMTKRLRREWFVRYLLDPQKYRPGTRMPAAWPRGQVAYPDVLGGTAQAQIEGIWTYLADGSQAKVPSGLQREAIELKPADRPLIYRNFLEGLSPRGIAVGYPEKAHFAWDAEHLTPRLIWHGAFIDASKHWVDRGPGNQVPLGDHVMTLPAGPPIAELPSLDQAWPDKNPRELDYHFKGYSLSKEGVPTFRSEWKGITIADTIVPFAASPDNGLARSLTIMAANRPQNLWLRLGSSANVKEENGEWVVDGVRFRIEGGEPAVRTMNGRQELLVPVSFDKDGTAKLRVVMVW